jgi:rhamnose utilization protein RhaD (predicted bifunctional aldolase and dehydrogenase)
VRFDRDTNRCVLCGKPKEEGRKVIIGLHGGICSDCVGLANDILGVAPTAMPGLSRPIVTELLGMTAELARPENGQVILAEGNVSCRDGETLWVKATGMQMGSATLRSFVQVSLDKVARSLDSPKPSDEDLRILLNQARIDQSVDLFPSTETFMHAWLLTLPNVNFVAHTHPETVLGLMCGPRAQEFAEHRYFPDQIVLCGPSSVFVPYVAPGFDLALAIRAACQSFGTVPKTILMQNHGMIALGRTANEAVAACLMMEKAARVFFFADDPAPLTPEQVAHIHSWTDEHYRQGQIWGE